jgi:CCR4-NOT transcription complex subunit 1
MSLASQVLRKGSNCWLLEKPTARADIDVTCHFFFHFQAVEGILDGSPSMATDPELMIRYRDIHLRVLKALQDPRAYGMQWTNKQVTRCVAWRLMR